MKFKHLFFTLIANCLFLNAQTKIEIEAKDFFWGANDKYKNSTEIPEKWEGESAVIIYKNINYDFHKFAKKVNYKSSIRKRIKLLDKVAVESYSEFKFKKEFQSYKGNSNGYTRPKTGENIIGIKIIKPDGEEIEIDIDENSVIVDGENKIAIPNLEIGDILDYYIYRVEPFKSQQAFGFDPVESTLAEEYPIMDYKLFFETENDFFINFNSFNGAPELIEIPTEKKNLRRYELSEKNIEKSKSVRWFYPLVELPTYKFQVYFARSGKFENRAIAFLPEKEDQIKKSVSEEEVLELYKNRFIPYGDMKNIKSFLKDKTFNSDTEKVKEVYYFIRHYYLTRRFERFIAMELDISYSAKGVDAVYIQNEKHFIKHFTEFLTENKIGYEIIVVKKRYDGKLSELLIEQNLNVLLKINTEETLYATYFGPHTTINSYSPFIEGTNGYVLFGPKKTLEQISKTKIPQSKHDQNETKKVISININEGFSELSFDVKNLYKGHAKIDQQTDKFIYSDYTYKDHEKYDTKTLVDRVFKKKMKVRVGNEFKAVIEKLKKNQKKSLENYAKGDFDLTDISDYEYEIIDNGRFDFESYFTYDESFKVKDAFVKKAGKNYIIEIGKVIGGQAEFKGDKRDRSENIYMNYARSFNYNIYFKIPDGYTVSGYDKLNEKIDNVTGAFISMAKIEDGVLIIETSKQYKTNFVPNSNWNLMLEFLDAANQFTNKKILLKKK